MMKLLRKINVFNKLENKNLTVELIKTIAKQKEKNSQIVWSHYYLPLAIKEILERDGYLLSANHKEVQHLATSMMFKDLSDGTLTEFYRFKEESEV